MSETNPTPEESYAWAQEQIARAKAENDVVLNLDYPEGRALERLPDEIGDLTQLELLNLDNTQVADLRALEGLSGLPRLYLGNTQVADLRALAGLSGLQTLVLNNTQVADLRALEGLSRLQGLFLNNTQVADLRALEGLSGLQALWLNNTPVSDLRALEGLSGLQTLFLDNTQVADLLPLAGLSNLGGEGAYALHPTGLRFAGTPAAERDDAHRALSAIEDDTERAKQVLQFLNGEHPEFGGPPEPWVAPAPPQPPEQQRGGVRFRSEADYLQPFAEGEIGARAAGMKPSVIEALEELSKPLPGSNDFPGPAKWAAEVLILVRRDLEDIDAEGWRLWKLSQQLARRQEADDRAQKDSSGMAKVMGPEMREALDGVVDTLPLFVRQFPECRYYDTETADRARDRSVEPAIGEILGDVERFEIVRPEVAGELLGGVPVEEDGREAGRRAAFDLFTTRNLVFAGLGVIATAAVSSVVTETVGGVLDGLGTRPAIEHRVREWLTSKPEPIEQIMRGAPKDVQVSVRAHLERLKAEPALLRVRVPPKKP